MTLEVGQAIPAESDAEGAAAIPPADCHSDAPVGTPGFRHGCWTIVIPGGGTLAMNLGYAVKLMASETGPGQVRDCLDRLYDAIEQAMPE